MCLICWLCEISCRGYTSRGLPCRDGAAPPTSPPSNTHQPCQIMRNGRRSSSFEAPRRSRSVHIWLPGRIVEQKPSGRPPSDPGQERDYETSLSATICFCFPFRQRSRCVHIRGATECQIKLFQSLQSQLRLTLFYSLSSSVFLWQMVLQNQVPAKTETSNSFLFQVTSRSLMSSKGLVVAECSDQQTR